MDGLGVADVLGVARSLGGKRWVNRLADERAAYALAQQTGQPEIVARMLAGRGIDADGTAAFLEPRLKEQLPDPAHLKDMAKAGARLAAAIAAGETIAIFGDYDVDGATSGALLHQFLTDAGGKVRLYIPDRIREGYGPNAAALQKLHEEGASLVVTVDCGITAHEPLAAAASRGLDVIVVDHHAAEPRLPPAHAVVNPNRLDETSPHRNLAAVGVSFLVAVETNRQLRQKGAYAGRAEPDLLALLDLVALGTVCDVVPLTGLNRALVVQGLKVLGQRQRIGLVALAEAARIDKRPEAYHLGFVLGPRVNAGGRVGEADLGVRLLTSTDLHAARAMAQRLDDFNRERQSIEAAVLESALAQLGPKPEGAMILAAGEGWHPGVIGIVASRLMERFDRPACVVALDKGVGKGSGRSVKGIDIGAAIIAARQDGLLINGGGHPAAAGFTVAADRVHDLRQFLNARMDGAVRPEPRMTLDGVLSLAAATTQFCETLERVGPFGAGNPEPRFAFAAVRIAKADIVGEKHVRCFLTDTRGSRLNAICFRAVGTPLGEALLNSNGASLHVAGRLRADEYRGAVRVQLQIEDAAPSLPT
jgi:single-stranded-DNA-specific exonuclease